MLFQKFKTRKNGSTSYRQEGSTVSVSFPATAFNGEAPDLIEINSDELAPVGARTVRVSAVNAEVAEAKRVLAEARAKRKEALAAKIAAMTPEQLAKREQNLIKLRERAAARKAQ